MPDASPAIMPTYGRLPVTFSKGEGAVLYDTNDRAYLDGVSGIAVTNLGHQYPRVTQAVAEQASRLIHTSNLFHIGLQEAVAEQLRAATGMENMFFCNSGAEANEAAIKLARRYGDQKGIASPQIIVLDGAFHGRTLGALSATGNKKIRQGFGPLLEGFQRVAPDDLPAIEALAAERQDIVAVLGPRQCWSTSRRRRATVASTSNGRSSMAAMTRSRPSFSAARVTCSCQARTTTL